VLVKVQNAIIYLLANDDKLSRRQIFEVNDKHIFAVWPAGEFWKAAQHLGVGWATLPGCVVFRTESDASKAVQRRLAAIHALNQ
jgi:hypothetical protein